MSVKKVEEELDEESTFYQQVETDASVCKNCYRRLYTEAEPHHQYPDSVSTIREYENWVDVAYFDDSTNSGNPSRPMKHCECGAADYRDLKIRPLDTYQLKEVGRRVVDRLHEKDVTFDENVFMEELERRKRNPDRQFNCEKILEQSLKFAKV